MNSVFIPSGTPAEDKAPAPDVQVVERISDDGKKIQHSVQFQEPVKKDDKKEDEKPAGDRPAWLPEKFKTADDLRTSATELAKKGGADERTLRMLAKLSPEDLAAEYADLEKTASKAAPKADEKADEKKEDKPVDAEAQITAQANAVVSKAGLLMSNLQSEWETNDGELSKESYDKLAAEGFGRDVVDGFIEGRQAVASLKLNEVFNAGGGSAEAYGKMMEWAKANLSKEDAVAFNQTIDKGTQSQRISAVKGLHARFQQGGGTEPAVVLGGDTKPGASSGDRYESTDQLLADQRDIRYRNGDKAFHKYVDEKLKRSKL